MFPGFIDLNDMNMNIMNNNHNMNNLNNMNMRMNDMNNMNNFMNTMNINDINMNIMNMNNMNMNNINMNNMNTGLFNMNNMDNGFNNAYNINNNMNNMNMNNMNSYMLNMNNINVELLKAFYFTLMMNQMNTLTTMINPYLFIMNQSNNALKTRFMPSRNQNDQIIIQNGGVLPRTYIGNNNRMKEELPFPEYTGPRINIIFETGSGLKYNIATPYNIPIKDVLLKYIRKVGVSESLLGNKIFFILNGLTIPANEERTVKEFLLIHNYGLGNQVKIVVIDGSNIIGAKRHD